MDFAANLKLLLCNCSDFGCGFLIFGGFSRVFGVFAMIFYLFVVFLGFMFVQFRGKWCEFRKDVIFLKKSSKTVCCDDDHGVKCQSFECGPRNLSRVCCGDHNVEEFGSEDEVFDVMSLRKMVKAERRKANAAQVELEKERMAASSSVDEAMAMILRLQSEKSVLQIRANQLERVAQEKQSHDLDVIESLQWIIMKHESERSLLEEQLRLCREKLRVYMKGDEWDQFECDWPSTFEAVDDDIVIRALQFDSPGM
ncbi:hypothetical protein vseg_007082 [Gypsophila vaccaria]